MTWYLEGRPVKLDARHVVEGHGSLVMLRIKSIDILDLGNYSCQAENSQGISRDHIELSGNITYYESLLLKNSNFIIRNYMNYPKNINVIYISGKPQKAVINSSPEGLYRNKYNLTWTVKSLQPLTEVRLLFRMMVSISRDILNRL